MIEVLFGESEAGSMRAAKCDRAVIGGADGPTACIGNPSRQKRDTVEWIEGKASEVVCLAFMLDIGNIKEEVDSQYRQDVIYCMYTQNGWDNSPEMAAELKQAAKEYVKEYYRLIEYLKQGETIRIWYSSSPYSLCGFYWLCSILRNYENHIATVKLPDYKQLSENTIARYTGWGEVAAEDFSQFLNLQKQMTVSEKRMFAALWEELKEDNSPLRAVISGKLTGVPEDFYDFLIKKHLTDKPVKEARMIGDILGRNPLGIGDWWYALRIDKMIQRGEIKIAENSEKKYARMICRS